MLGNSLFSSSSQKNAIRSISPRYTLCWCPVVQLSGQALFVIFEWLVIELPAVNQRVSGSVFQRSPIIIVYRIGWISPFKGKKEILFPRFIHHWRTTLGLSVRISLLLQSYAFWRQFQSRNIVCKLEHSCMAQQNKKPSIQRHFNHATWLSHEIMGGV